MGVFHPILSVLKLSFSESLNGPRKTVKRRIQKKGRNGIIELEFLDTKGINLSKQPFPVSRKCLAPLVLPMRVAVAIS
jgi:hypothetical protein